VWPFWRDYTGRPQRIYVRYVDALLRYTRFNDYDVICTVFAYSTCTVPYGKKPKQYKPLWYGTVPYGSGTVKVPYL